MWRAVLSRDRAVVLGGLVVVIGLAWAYLVLGAGLGPDGMDMGGGQVMRMARPWTPGYAATIFAMWAVMMVAMMLPGAAPMLLLVASMARGAGQGATAAFALGYLLVWAGFSLGATGLQWGLERAGALSPAMAMGSAWAAGAVLIAAGAYQWTTLKQACLLHCQSPMAFLMQHWRPGGWAALANGVRHGVFCLGCCWMLMLVLFVVGVMNLLWIAALALLVLLEKTVPLSGRMSRMTGAALIGWGVLVLVGSH